MTCGWIAFGGQVRPDQHPVAHNQPGFVDVRDLEREHVPDGAVDGTLVDGACRLPSTIGLERARSTQGPDKHVERREISWRDGNACSNGKYSRKITMAI
jgi:hypothetical protein